MIHGTTLVINSIIERKGARTGLITTKGFRDVLELGREIRYAPYDIFAEFPKPLVPRQLPAGGGREDPERRDDPQDPWTRKKRKQVVRSAARDMGVESIAVCLLNSFENPTHELMIKEIIEKEAPPGLRLHLLPRAAPDPGVRANEHDRDQCLCQAADRKVSVQALRKARSPSAPGASSSSCSRAGASPPWTRLPSSPSGSSSPGPPPR